MIEMINKCIDRERVSYSIYIKNLKNDEVYKYNEEAVVSSASIIKLFIMAEVLNQVQNNELGLNDRVNVKEEEKVDGSIVTLLSSDNSYTIKDLLTLMIIQSDNTATNLLIDIAGMDNINSFIKGNGFEDTILQRKMMDFKARKLGKDNYTTAKDTALFLQRLYDGKLLNEEGNKLMIDIMRYQLDDRMIRRNIDEKVMIAHKTGDIEGLNHEAALVYGKESDFILVMFTWDCKDNLYGREVIGEVSKLVYDRFNNQGSVLNENKGY